MPDAPFRFEVLGGVDLVRPDGSRVQSVLQQPKRVALLGYVAIEAADGFLQRERIMSVLWPESDEARARQSLRNGLYRIRQSAGAEILLNRGAGEVGVDPGLLAVDAVRFRGAVAHGRFADAVALYRGELLPGLHLDGNREFEEWLTRVRTALHRDALQAFRETARSRAEAGDVEGARSLLRRAQEMAPADEEILRRRLLLLAEQGNGAAALAEGGEWIESLRKRLGLQPSAATLELMADLRSGRFDAARGRSAPRTPPPSPTPTALVARPASTGATARAVPRPAPRRAIGPAWRPVAGWIFGPALLIAAAWASAGRTARLPSAEAGVIVERFEADEAAGGEAAGLALGTLAARLLDEGDGAFVLPAEGVSAASPDGTERRLVAGSLRREGDGLAADITLATTSEPEDVLVRAAASVDRFDLEALAVRLVDALARESERSMAPRDPVPAFTRVPAAVLPYFEGEIAAEAARRADAIEAYERALDLDSTFAMAHFRLSMQLESTGRREEAIVVSDRAVALSAELSGAERRRLQAWRVYEWGNVEQALPLYQALAASGGPDRDVWLKLGEIGFHWGAQLGMTREAADGAFETLLALVPSDADALLHRLRLLAPTSEPAKLEEVLSRIGALDISRDVRAETRAISDLIARRPLDDDVGAWVVSGAYSFESRRLTQLAASARVPRDLAPFVRSLPPGEEPERQALRRLLLAQLAAASGRMREARSELDSLAERHPDRALEYRIFLELASPVPPRADTLRALRARLNATPHLAGSNNPLMSGVARAGIYGPRAIVLHAMLTRRIGEPIDSAGTMERARSLADPFDREYARLLQSEIASAAGADERLLGLLGPGRPEWHRQRPDPLSYLVGMSRWSRVRALLAVGNDDDALRWLETFPDMGGYDLVYMPEASLLRARILERQGRRGEAARAYRRAAELWEGADPELLHLLDEAREGERRMAGAPGA